MTRHPRRRELTAWFDGEGSDEISAHVARCSRCTAVLDDFGLVRAAVRGESLPLQKRLPALVFGVRPVLAVAVALVLGLVVGSAVPTREWDGPIRLASRALGRDERSSVSLPSASARPGSVDTRRTTAAPPAGGSSSRPASDRPAALAPRPVAPAVRSLELAVVVPSDGPDAAEGRAVERAARASVDAANRSGGVAGHPVRLNTITYRVGETPVWGKVDAVVGGFVTSAPPGGTWLLPADPYAAGKGVLRGELGSRETGRRLALDLLAHERNSPVGVVVGKGEEAELAAGLGEVTKVVTAPIDARGECDGALFALRRQGARSVALAGPPAMVATCADTLLTMGWAPAEGMLVPSSLAYSALQHRLSLHGARTVLGLPWPTAASAGAERFRAVAPPAATESYRALITFAATELAVAAAREGAMPSDLFTGTWRTDLVHFDRGANLDAAVVEAGDHGWDRPA